MASTAALQAEMCDKDTKIRHIRWCPKLLVERLDNTVLVWNKCMFWSQVAPVPRSRHRRSMWHFAVGPWNASCLDRPHRPIPRQTSAARKDGLRAFLGVAREWSLAHRGLCQVRRCRVAAGGNRRAGRLSHLPCQAAVVFRCKAKAKGFGHHQNTAAFDPRLCNDSTYQSRQNIACGAFGPQRGQKSRHNLRHCGCQPRALQRGCVDPAAVPSLALPTGGARRTQHVATNPMRWTSRLAKIQRSKGPASRMHKMSTCAAVQRLQLRAVGKSALESTGHLPYVPTWRR